MFLLDADMVSLRRRPNRRPVVFQWLEAQQQVDLHLSVVTLAELARCVIRQRRSNPEFALDLTLERDDPEPGSLAAKPRARGW